jgi:hypothetical protein
MECLTRLWYRPEEQQAKRKVKKRIHSVDASVNYSSIRPKKASSSSSARPRLRECDWR